MITTNTIHIEPLDEGYVVTHDGKRKAMTHDEVKALFSLVAFQCFLDAAKNSKSDWSLTFTLHTDIPKTA